MNINGKNIFIKREYPVLVIGVIGLILYFWLTPIQAPDSSITTPVEQSQIITNAQSFLRKQGFSDTGLEPEARLQRFPRLLDSLNTRLGRRQTTILLKHGGKQQLPAYYWHVSFYPGKNLEKKLDAEQEENERPANLMQRNPIFELDITQNGAVWQFTHTGSQGPPKPLTNREALATILPPSLTQIEADSLNELLSTFSDTLLDRQMIFALQQFQRPFDQLHHITKAYQLNRILNNHRPLFIDKTEAVQLARYHLNQTDWKYFEFKTDSVYVVPGADRKIARVNFSAESTLLRQPIHVNVDVSAAGGLVGINALHMNATATSQDQPDIGALIMVLIYALLLIFFIFIFIRKLDARLIDTRTAIVDGVIGWFLAILPTLLSNIYQIHNLSSSASFIYYLIILISPLVLGFGAGFLMFLGSGTTESLARNVVPEKTETLTLLRRGYLHNHRFGSVCLQSVFLGLAMAGLYTLTLFLFPHVSLFQSGSTNSFLFLSDRTFLAPVYMIGRNGYFALAMGFFILFGIGSYTYNYRNRPWMMILITGIIFSLLTILPVSNNLWANWAVNGIVGLAVGYIYYRYDFLTAVLSFFFLTILLQTGSGWMIPHSPDLTTALTAWIVILTIGAIGVWGLYSPQSGGEIPEYVPRYIEEFSQKQRMERELEIARSVQASFLPRDTPQPDSFEISAICHSAFEVGGDYYDFIDLGNGKTAVAIGDVSGKGIQAAFYMTLVKGFIQSLCHQIESPAKLLEHTNTLFCRNAERGTFISMIYGILDSEKHTFTFARAGHNPLLYRESPDHKADILRPSGLALGLTDKDIFADNITDVTLKVNSESLIVMFTDGFPEAMNAQKKLYGDERLISSVTKYAQLNAREMIETIIGDVQLFVNGQHQHDDMTMIIIKSK